MTSTQIAARFDAGHQYASSIDFSSVPDHWSDPYTHSVFSVEPDERKRRVLYNHIVDVPENKVTMALKEGDKYYHPETGRFLGIIESVKRVRRGTVCVTTEVWNRYE